MTTPVTFGQFDFDNSPEWQAYLRRAEVLPEGVFRAKAKWYKQYVNPAFVLSGDMSDAAPPVPPPVPSGAAPPPSPTPTPTPTGGFSGAGAGAGNGVQSEGALGGDGMMSKLKDMDAGRLADSFVAVSHGALSALGAGYLVFMLLVPRLASVLYHQFLLVAAVSHLAKVGRRYGAPPFLPWQGFQPTLRRLKAWMIPVAATTDLQYAVISVSLLSTRPLLPAIIPMFVVAVYHTSYLLAARVGSHPLYQQYGAPLHSQLVAKQRTAQLSNAGAEILTGFLLAGMLVTPSRSLLQTFLYWQILRTRYWTPDCREYHRQAWAMVGAQTQPLLNAVPFLQTPVGFVQRWFESAVQPQAHQQ